MENRTHLKKKRFIIIVFCLFISFIIYTINVKPAFSAEAILKNGKKIEGRIIGQDADSITIIDKKTRKASTYKRKDIKKLTDGDKVIIGETKEVKKVRKVRADDYLFSSKVILKKKNQVILCRILEITPGKVVLIEKETRKNMTIRRYKIKKIITLEKDKLDELRRKNLEERMRIENEGSFVGKFKPMAGLLGSTGIAVGDIGEVIVPGGGVKIYGDMLFLKFGGNFELRSGLLFGFSYNDAKSDNYTTNLMFIPFWVYADLAYPLNFGLRPYFRLGMGITAVMLKGDPGSAEDLPETSGVDFTIPITIGAGYTFKALPMIEWVFDFTTIIQMETVSGYFISISLGAAYKF
ncbi:hypothetical protein ACFL20_00405 [Spirochaetota bacterium]